MRLRTSGAIVTSGVLGFTPLIVDCEEANPHLNVKPVANSREGIMHIPFYFVDVFAEQPLSGTPLAIVPHAEGLTDATMQKIAAELN